MRYRRRSNVERLIRYVVLISLIGAGSTLALDQLATAAEAPAVLHDLVVQGGAGVFAFLGVVLYSTGLKG
jgi:hypothetical protein